MSKRFLSWPTSLASALVALGAVTTVVVAQNNPQRPGTPDNAPAAGKAMKVGVVDIGLLFRDYKRKDVLEGRVNAEREQNALKKRVEEFTLQILTELETTIRTYGERHRFDLILKSDREEQTPEGQQSELVQQFQERIFRAQISDVLFFAPTVDITDNVKRLLNDDDNMKRMEQLEVERERRRAAAASAPPAAPGTTAPTPAGGAQTPQGQRGN
jgi:Skp family chaperone for outer membrane proteins